LECGALHAEDGGGAFGAGDAPFGLAEGAEDVLALSFFESRNWRAGGVGLNGGTGIGIWYWYLLK